LPLAGGCAPHHGPLVGDAILLHPPSNGLGSNTSILDSSNSCWKLAMVLMEHAGKRLLNIYNADRKADRHPRQSIHR